MFVFYREAIKEDEAGSLQATVDDIIQRAKRKRLADRPVNVRLGMVSPSCLSKSYILSDNIHCTTKIHCYLESVSYPATNQLYKLKISVSAVNSIKDPKSWVRNN